MVKCLVMTLLCCQEYAMLKAEGHSHRVKSLSFTSSGEVLASAGAKKVKLWTRVGHLKSELNWRPQVYACCSGIQPF